MATKEECVRKYREYKQQNNGRIPKLDEFLKYSGIGKRSLPRLFGSTAYSKLQAEAGDAPNRLQMERTSLETIMRQYGDLVTEIGILPPYAEWDARGLKPTESGLWRKPHNMRWTDLPTRFTEWVTTNSVPGIDQAIEIIANSGRATAKAPQTGDREFLRLIKDVRAWTPARRRNNEGEYKIELRKHLESLSYKLNEEYGHSTKSTERANMI